MPQKPVKIGAVKLRPHVPTLVVPFTNRTPLAALRKAHAQGLAFAEARVDLFADRSVNAVRRVVRDVGRVLPVLLTIRSSKEGGAWQGDDAGRLALYRALLPDVAAVDVELAAAQDSQTREGLRLLQKTLYGG